MDKKHLQHTILEAPYNREVWLDVLKEYFGVRKIHIKPHQIIVDTSKAEYAVELGSFTTIDEKVVGIFEVKLLPHIWIERNRVGLRSLLRQVYKYDVDGALIVFVQDDKWRFSYVSEIRTEDGKKETEPKRYTYLFGKNESSRTAADRFDKLKNKPIYLNDLFESFSVEKLTKEFFKTYKEFYERFWKYLAGEKKYYSLLVDKKQTEEEKKQKPIRDFSKKLLGRIVFLQFLQKKGWMGVPSDELKWEGGDVKFLQSLFKNHNNKNKFHSTALKTLFFETLNTKRVDDLAPASLGFGIKIPYLNGGLFDKDISWQYDFDFPVDLFENLFDFFEQYNFTIDENDPYDNQVGIDPEMLGHIFENLLEENREKGAFYTPKEIVHYMCQESLIEYLHTQIPGNAKEDFNLLVRSNQVAQSFTLHQKAIEINNKLKAVKICDPAIGSGAFPMGLLKEIFECRRLIYPYLKTNESFKPAEVKKDIIQQNIYGVDIENGAVEIARLRFWLALVVDEIEPQPLPNLDYKIMQGNSLLESFEGVDLSNLADLEKEQSFISASKTQLELGAEFSLDKTTMLVFDEKSKRQLYDLINDYYSYDQTTNTKYPNKQFIKDEINKIVEGKLIAKFFLEKPKIETAISTLKKSIASNTIKKNDTPALIKKKEKNIEKLKRDLDRKQQELEKLNFIIKQLHELQTRTDKPYFLWRLWFKEIFDIGGFDIMIGNPPYIKEPTNRNAFDGFRKTKYYQGKMDLWYGFACVMLDNLKKDTGILTFIATNNWVTNVGASKFRNKVVEDAQLLQLIDFGNYKIFESADIQTMIMLLKTNNKEPEYQFDYRRIIDTQVELDDVVQLFNVVSNSKIEILNPSFNRELFADKSFLFSEGEIDDILSGILSASNFQLDDRLEIAQGIVAPQDFVNKSSLAELGVSVQLNEGIFYLTDKEKNELNLTTEELKLVKPFYSTTELERYYGDKKNKYWVIYTDSSFKNPNVMKFYPNLKKHLDRFQKVITSDNKPYGLHRARNEHFFIEEKIISLRKCARPTFTYTDFNCYVSQTYFVIKTKRVNQKYLAALLNSKLIAFWLKHKGKMQGFQYQVDKGPLIELPLITSNEQDLFASLVDYIIFLKDNSDQKINDYVSNEHIVQSFEDVINACVYELYFAEHMKEKEIDVLHFAKDLIRPINKTEKVKEKIDILNSVYSKLKEPRNEIRNRMLLFATRSENILLPIQKTY